MKKLLNILFVRKAEIKNKWWHRLVNVVIYGSTILVAIFAITLFVSNSEIWKKYFYTAFNFESNYSTAIGKEVKCTTESKPFSVYCEGDSILSRPFDTSELVKRYNKIIRDKIGAEAIQRICDEAKQNKPVNTNRLTQEEIKCINLTNDFVPISPADFINTENNQITYTKYLTNEQASFVRIQDFDLATTLKAKRTIKIIYPIFFKNLMYVIFDVVAWFIFWESIIYRVILYIIYGKNKTI